MATIAHSSAQTTGHGFADRVRSLSLRFHAYRAEARKRSQIIRELSTYTDNELLELGFSRHDIPAVAAGTFRR